MTQVDFVEKMQETITILIVEDDPDIGYFLAFAFESELNAHVLLADDAARALEIIETITPHLFVLDYRLPDMDGLELAEHLSTLPQCTSLPILLMSATLPEQAQKNPHIATIEKPFELDEMLRMVSQLLK